MPNWDFAVTEPIDVSVHLQAGSVTVSAAPTDQITVDVQPTRSGRQAEEYAADVRVSFADGRLVIAEPAHSGWLRYGSGLDIVVAVPAGSRCVLDTAAADISCLGEFASLSAKSASGEIKAATVTGAADLHSTSGAVSLGSADTAKVKTASGAIEVGQVHGDVHAVSVSGKVLIGTVGGSAIVQSSSGRLKIESLARGTAQLETVSGEIKVNVVPGTGVYLDLSSISGRVTSDLDSDDGASGEQVDLRLSCKTVSGTIRVGRAALAELAS